MADEASLLMVLPRTSFGLDLKECNLQLPQAIQFTVVANCVCSSDIYRTC